MASWMRRGGATEVTCPKSERGFNSVDSLPVHVIQHVECAGGEAEVRGLVSLIGSDGEIVAPSQIEVDIAWAGFGVASHAIGPRVEEAVAVRISAGNLGPGRAGVCE